MSNSSDSRATAGGATSVEQKSESARDNNASVVTRIRPMPNPGPMPRETPPQVDPDNAITERSWQTLERDDISVRPRLAGCLHLKH